MATADTSPSRPATPPAEARGHAHGHAPVTASEVSLEPSHGWHVSHFFYRFDRDKLAAMPEAARRAGGEAFVAALANEGDTAVRRLQTWIVPGHKADFAVMLMDPSPLRVEAVHQRLMAGPLGPAMTPSWSFIGLTEVSEYLPNAEQYGERLIEEGETRDSPTFKAKVQGYAAREAGMRKARIEPDLPSWPNACFYPMNKKRKVGGELVFAPARRANPADGRTWPQRDEVWWPRLPADHRQRRPRRLGMGCHPLGQPARLSQRDRLHNAV